MTPEAGLQTGCVVILILSIIGFAFVLIHEHFHPSLPTKDAKTLKDWIRKGD